MKNYATLDNLLKEYEDNINRINRLESLHEQVVTFMNALFNNGESALSDYRLEQFIDFTQAPLENLSTVIDEELTLAKNAAFNARREILRSTFTWQDAEN